MALLCPAPARVHVRPWSSSVPSPLIPLYEKQTNKPRITVVILFPCSCFMVGECFSELSRREIPFWDSVPGAVRVLSQHTAHGALPMCSYCSLTPLDAGLSFLSVTQQPMSALLAPPHMEAELWTTSAIFQHLSSPFGHSF